MMTSTACLRCEPMLRIMFMLIITAVLIGGGSANAQMVSVPCQAFGQSPLVCVNNQSAWGIDWIDCDGYHVSVVSSSFSYIPGGTIGVAKFPKGFCQVASFHTVDGRLKVGAYLDARNSTVITIPGWRW